MIATGGLVSRARRAEMLGLAPLHPEVDLKALGERVRLIETRLATQMTSRLESQGVVILRGWGRMTGPHRVEVELDDGQDGSTGGTEAIDADAVLLATGSFPRVPYWAQIDGERVLTTRQAYPPPVIPEHLVVIGSGVTGVEFVHMFESLGSKVTLIVSRQQVLPAKDPEVAAALEADFLERGVALCIGARAIAIDRSDDKVAVRCNDGRVIEGSHALICIGSIPASDGLGLDAAGVRMNAAGYVPVNHHCLTNVPHIYAVGDLAGRLPLASVAAAQGHKVAEHVMGLHTREHRHLDYDKAASAIFTEPEIADVGLAESEAFALGRKIRVTKVPYAANARALIDGDSRGFIKLISDPYTGVVLGGSIVGTNAAELVSVIALAVTSHLRVIDLAESLFVHPALAEALAEAAE